MFGDRGWRQGFCFVFLLWLTFYLEDRLGPIEVMHTVTLNLSSVFQRHGSRNVFAGAARLSCLQGGRLGRSIASRFIWPYFWSLRTMRWCKAVILPCVCGWCKTKLLLLPWSPHLLCLYETHNKWKRLQIIHETFPEIFLIMKVLNKLEPDSRKQHAHSWWHI